jgi:acyl carrier protein
MSKLECRVKSVMVKLFKVTPEEINDESSLHDVKDWSSMTHLELIAKLEDEFGIVFDENEIPSMINFIVICSTIESYLD